MIGFLGFLLTEAVSMLVQDALSIIVLGLVIFVFWAEGRDER